MPRRSAASVQASRTTTLEAAVDLASVEGLEGLTIGRLADQLSMSKSGLVGRFGDKEALQRAVLGAAVDRFIRAVWQPAARADPGLPRLEALVDAWIDYLRRDVFPGGCFVTTASVEYDARPGPLRDDVAGAVRQWLDALSAQGARAGLADPEQVALELHALASGGSVASRLLGDPALLDRTRVAMRAAIGLR